MVSITYTHISNKGPAMAPCAFMGLRKDVLGVDRRWESAASASSQAQVVKDSSADTFACRLLRALSIVQRSRLPSESPFQSAEYRPDVAVNHRTCRRGHENVAS